MWLWGNSSSFFSLCSCPFPKQVVSENKYFMSAKYLGSAKMAEVFVPQPSPGSSLSSCRGGAEPVLETGQARLYHPFQGMLPHRKISSSRCFFLRHVSKGLIFCPEGFSVFGDWIATFVTEASERNVSTMICLYKFYQSTWIYDF